MILVSSRLILFEEEHVQDLALFMCLGHNKLRLLNCIWKLLDNLAFSDFLIAICSCILDDFLLLTACHAHVSFIC